MRSLLAVGLLVSMLGLSTQTVLAHHSFSAEFDVGRPVTLVGTVKEFEWTNPHAWIHIEVADAAGATQVWAVEMLGVNSLVRDGLRPDTMKAGDKLTITGYGARNGTTTANASTVSRTETGETLYDTAPPGAN
jgi:hypothetical protein